MKLFWSRLLVIALLEATQFRTPRILGSSATISDEVNDSLLKNKVQEIKEFQVDGEVNVTDLTPSILSLDLDEDMLHVNSTNHEIESLRINPMNDNMLSGRLMGRLTPGEQSTSVSLTYTCRERCGDTSLYPCSCSSSCLIYNTCCENMTQDCPDIVQHGYRLFGSFIGSDVRCEAEEIFKIESCPGGAETNKPVTNTDFSRGMASNSNDSDDSYTEISVSELERAVLNVPVTDLVSNVTFINRAIFDCPLWQGTVEPMHWALRLKYIQINPRTLKDINKVYLPNPYAPTFNDTILDRHRCSNAIVRSCEKNEISHTNDLERKCGEFMGVVQSKVTKVFYHNKYCAYCHEEEHNGFELAHYVPPSDDIPLSNQTTLAFADEHQPGKIFFQVEEPPPYSSWTSAICPTLDVTVNGDASEEDKVNVGNKSDLTDLIASLESTSSPQPCQVTCGTGFFPLFIYNYIVCYTALNTIIALTDEIHDFFQRGCQEGFLNLGSFVICSLAERVPNSLLELAYFIPSYSFRTLPLLDLATNTTLTMMAMQVAMPSVASETLLMDPAIFYHTSIIIRAYHAYKHPQSFCQRSGKDAQSRDDIFSVPLGDIGEDLDEAMTKYRGPVVDTTNMLKYCTSRLTRHSVIDNFHCYEDYFRETDQQQVEEFLNNTRCTEFLDLPIIDQAFYTSSTEPPTTTTTSTMNPSSAVEDSNNSGDFPTQEINDIAAPDFSENQDIPKIPTASGNSGDSLTTLAPDNSETTLGPDNSETTEGSAAMTILSNDLVTPVCAVLAFSKWIAG